MEVPKELQHRYLERRKRDLETCLYYLGQEKFEEIEKVGHQLKGNGSTFGHSELTDIGVSLEKAAHSKNLPELKKAVEDFSTWVNNHLN
jgi:HPt (histidine-containing phosphotransfer) domain-containing protein